VGLVLQGAPCPENHFLRCAPTPNSFVSVQILQQANIILLKKEELAEIVFNNVWNQICFEAAKALPENTVRIILSTRQQPSCPPFVLNETKKTGLE